jgi:hypothetical protein
VDREEQGLLKPIAATVLLGLKWTEKIEGDEAALGKADGFTGTTT